MLTRYWALDVFGRLQVDFDEASYNFELMEKHRALVDNAQLKLLLNLSTVLLKRQKQPNGIGNTSGDSDIFDPRLARTCADEALRVSKRSSEKALLRKAEAALHLNDFPAATEALQEAEKLLNQRDGSANADSKGVVEEASPRGTDADVATGASQPSPSSTAHAGGGNRLKLHKLQARLHRLRKEQAKARKATWGGKLNKVPQGSGNEQSLENNAGDRKPTQEEVEAATTAATAAVEAALRRHAAEKKAAAVVRIRRMCSRDRILYFEWVPTMTTMLLSQESARRGKKTGNSSKADATAGGEEAKPIPMWLKLLMEGTTFAVMAVVYFWFFK
eukprot:INCI1109.2.p2 GENE.INCI1109.2~~INCI1109.2.p2  ORF type:complete len:332 (-),score=76.80 INCI1109.2:1828-2823(-)